MKVLIIDDERAILKMYAEQMQLMGIEALTAPDGPTGLRLAVEDKPDVILLDIIMPRLNGLDVLAQLKEDQETRNIPVFLLTNLPEECSGEKAKELGAAGYFVKAQYDPDKIIEKVKNYRPNTAIG